MASLDLSAVVTSSVMRKETLGGATLARLVTLPRNLGGARGAGMRVSIYAVTSPVLVVSPDETQPTEDAAYVGTKCAYIPANTWVTFPVRQASTDPASLAIVPTVGASEIYITVEPLIVVSA